MSNQKSIGGILILALVMGLFLFACIQEAVSAAEKGLAMITNLKGTAKQYVAKKKKWKTAKLMAVLKEEDQIELPAGGSATIVFFVDSHEETVKGPATVEVIAGSGKSSPDKLKILKGDKNSVAVSKQTGGVKLPSNPEVTSDQILGMVVRGGNKELEEDTAIRHLTPVEAIRNTKPTFKWEKIPGATKYVFSLSKGLNKKIIEDVEVAESNFPYPDSAQPLEYGEDYTWKVRALKDSREIASGSFSFYVLDRDTLDGIEAAEKSYWEETAKSPKDPAPYIKMATVYIEAELYDDALPALDKLVEIDSENENIYTLRVLVFDMLGMKDKAKEAEQLAEKYGTENKNP